MATYPARSARGKRGAGRRIDGLTAKTGKTVKMGSVLLVIHLMLALSLIGVVLLQRSEGGGLGIGGGGGGGGGMGGF